MSTDFSPNSPKKYICLCCTISCNKQTEWSRHINTNKHKINEQKKSSTNISPIKYECSCGKVYKERSGLWRHSKVCSKNNNNINSNDISNIQNIQEQQNKTIELILQENNNFKNIIVDIMKNNQELQKQMIDVCSKIQPSTINNTNSHNNNNNKTFNLQFFLNEECKDAMNLQDFVESVQLQMTDLEKIGELGYIEGVSKFIMGKLNETDVNKRPVHCSDAKRETLYVKDDNVWTKEGEENSKIRGAVKKIEKKNIKLLNAWKETHAGCMDSDSPYNDQYTHMIIGSLGGCEPDNVNKVIKKIAKATIIDK
jgi:hypothetical protein